MTNTFLVQEIIPKKARKRFPMYTGEWTLNSICIYLNGYTHAMQACGFKENHYLSFWYFHEFVKDTFGFFESTSGWKNMIIAHSLGYESSMKDWCWEDMMKKEKTMSHEEHVNSTDIFFQLFDKFYSLSLVEFYLLKMARLKPKFSLEIEEKTYGIGFNKSPYNITASYTIAILEKYKNSYIVYYDYSSFEKTDFTKKENYHQFNTPYEALHFLYILDFTTLNELEEIEKESRFIPETAIPKGIH